MLFAFFTPCSKKFSRGHVMYANILPLMLSGIFANAFLCFNIFPIFISNMVNYDKYHAPKSSLRPSVIYQGEKEF